jgi:hypothetical protein
MPVIRTQWSKEEFRLVAERVAQIESAHRNLVSAVDAAQREVLPELRWRKMPKGPSGFVGLMPYLNTARTRSVSVPASAPPPISPPLEDRQGIDSEASMTPPHFGAPPPEQPTLEETLLPVKAYLSDFLAEVMVDSLRKLLTNGEIARVLRSVVNGEIPTVIQEDRPKHSAFVPTVAIKSDRLTLLICGFLPHQQNQFVQAFPKVHFRFWYSQNPSTGIEQLREKAKTADTVLFKMEQTSHTAVQVVQSLGKPIVRVTGGGQAMLQAIERAVSSSTHH